MNIIVSEVTCPNCGAAETHPTDIDKPILERRLLIRAFKVEIDGHWHSQCLVCSGLYDARLHETTGHDPRKGWF
jgi:predicted nucleic-acid-binding Zn-ribbon protein